MPERLDRCVKHVMQTGKSESEAFAICRSALDLAYTPAKIGEMVAGLDFSASMRLFLGQGGSPADPPAVPPAAKAASGGRFDVFARLIKVDEEKRQVWGVIAEERVDKVREIMDYNRSKPYFQEWSEGIREISGGKSLGNVREMHSNIAAGKVISIEFQDEQKQILVCAEIVDDSSWAKIKKGVLNGFSIGGEYIDVWDDPKDQAIKWYTGRPIEVSVVDNPAMYGAKFQFIRAGGLVADAIFKGVDMEEDKDKRPAAPESAGAGSSAVEGEKPAAAPAEGTRPAPVAPPPAQAPETEKAEGGEAQTPPAAPEPTETGGMNADSMWEMIKPKLLAALKELGLVVEEGEKAAPAMAGEVAGLREEVGKAARAGDLSKAFGDLVKIAAAVQDLGKRVSAMEETPPGFGPVLREIGSGAPQNLAGMEKQALEGLLEKTTDPAAKAAIRQQLVDLETRAAQAVPMFPKK